MGKSKMLIASIVMVSFMVWSYFRHLGVLPFRYLGILAFRHLPLGFND